MEGITSIQRGLLQRCKGFNNLKEIAQEQYVCRACELSIKRRVKKKDNRYTSSGRLLLCSMSIRPVPLYIGRGTSTWLDDE